MSYALSPQLLSIVFKFWKSGAEAWAQAEQRPFIRPGSMGRGACINNIFIITIEVVEENDTGVRGWPSQVMAQDLRSCSVGSRRFESGPPQSAFSRMAPMLAPLVGLPPSSLSTTYSCEFSAIAPVQISLLLVRLVPARQPLQYFSLEQDNYR